MELNYLEMSKILLNKHVQNAPLNNYPGIVTLHGIARMALQTGDKELEQKLDKLLSPFYKGEIDEAGKGGLYNEVYRCGGNASALLNFEGKIKGAKKNLIKNAELLCNKHSRSKEGVFDTLNRIDKTHGLIWIDTVFAVCPFLLWIGLEAERDDFIDESCFQMIKHHKILFDKEMKLYHQAIHFNKPDTLSPAHWARGAGWAAIALSELCCYLPEKHPEREKIFGYFHEFLEGCRNTQDNDGMWHQVMEKFETPDRFEPDYQSKLVNGELAKIMASYPESSGTALILYGMGRALEKEVVCWDEYGECYRKGLKALSGYVGLDGSVFNCCVGCCAPGNGTVEDYEQHPHDRLNNHGFGSVILAFSVAEALCSKELIPPLANIIGG